MRYKQYSFVCLCELKVCVSFPDAYLPLLSVMVPYVCSWLVAKFLYPHLFLMNIVFRSLNDSRYQYVRFLIYIRRVAPNSTVVFFSCRPYGYG